MEADQDWCLSCGTAAPGRLGERPGWRAASTVIALTLLLVLGAVGAGYAALTGDGKPAPPAAAAPQTQAQVTPPPAATAPPATTTTPPAATQTQPATPKNLPKVHTPTAGATPGSPVTPTPTPTAPAPTTSPSPSPATGAGSAPATTTPTTVTGTRTTPADTGPKPIDLNGDAGTMYDPYGRAKASGDATRALDGDTTTSWYVDPNDPQQVAVGYAVDLGKLQGIREIRLQTPTAGFRVEIYATDVTQLPPDILDTRWSHIKDVSNVGAKDGTQRIVLGAGSTKYRNVLLWFTQPPTDGPRLRITELNLLG